MMHPAPKFSPELFFDNVNAYYRTAALKTAIELDLFSAIGEAGTTSQALAEARGCTVRGIRIICDYLVYAGLLCKDGERYYMTTDMVAFLDRRSPGYIGGCIEFLLSEEVTSAFSDLSSVVRTGQTTNSRNGALDPDHPQWVKFARAMQSIMRLPSLLLAEQVDRSRRPLRVLDVASGHGLFGIAFADQNPHAEVTAIDWGNVLQVARENAANAGVIDRVRFVPGDAFEVDFGEGYDLVLFANFLHHFDTAQCSEIAAKAYRVLKPGGRAVTFEFIANEDRISPPLATTFSMMMLGTTPAGEVYTFAEIENIFSGAGFARSELCSLAPALEKVVISYR